MLWHRLQDMCLHHGLQVQFEEFLFFIKIKYTIINSITNIKYNIRFKRKKTKLKFKAYQNQIKNKNNNNYKNVIQTYNWYVIDDIGSSGAFNFFSFFNYLNVSTSGGIVRTRFVLLLISTFALLVVRRLSMNTFCGGYIIPSTISTIMNYSILLHSLLGMHHI